MAKCPKIVFLLDSTCQNLAGLPGSGDWPDSSAYHFISMIPEKAECGPEPDYDPVMRDVTEFAIRQRYEDPYSWMFFFIGGISTAEFTRIRGFLDRIQPYGRSINRNSSTRAAIFLEDNDLLLPGANQARLAEIRRQNEHWFMNQDNFSPVLRRENAVDSLWRFGYMDNEGVMITAPERQKNIIRLIQQDPAFFYHLGHGRSGACILGVQRRDETSVADDLIEQYKHNMIVEKIRQHWARIQSEEQQKVSTVARQVREAFDRYSEQIRNIFEEKFFSSLSVTGVVHKRSPGGLLNQALNINEIEQLLYGQTIRLHFDDLWQACTRQWTDLIQISWPDILFLESFNSLQDDLASLLVIGSNPGRIQNGPRMRLQDHLLPVIKEEYYRPLLTTRIRSSFKSVCDRALQDWRTEQGQIKTYAETEKTLPVFPIINDRIPPSVREIFSAFYNNQLEYLMVDSALAASCKTNSVPAFIGQLARQFPLVGPDKKNDKIVYQARFNPIAEVRIDTPVAGLAVVNGLDINGDMLWNM